MEAIAFIGRVTILNTIRVLYCMPCEFLPLGISLVQKIVSGLDLPVSSVLAVHGRGCHYPHLAISIISELVFILFSLFRTKWEDICIAPQVHC